jgi:hypothetical protein
MEQLVNPDIVRGKFDRELKRCRDAEVELRRRGCWIISAQFPVVTVAFVSSQLRPPTVLFTTEIDFTNYDIWPPSVRLINVFTGDPMLARELPAALTFSRRVAVAFPPGIPLPPGAAQLFAEQPLLVSHSPDEAPFFCFPGVREYHDHPAHSGDSWLLHRGAQEGTLFFIIDNLYRYGVEPIKGFQIGFQIIGFNRPEAPA